MSHGPGSVGRMPANNRMPQWWRRIEHPDGLLLRELLPDDVEGVFAVHGDPRVYELDPDATHLDLAQSRAFLAPQLEHWRAHGFGYWSVLVPRDVWPDGVAGAGEHDDGRVIAGMGGIVHRTVVTPAVLNVYFRLSPAVQGRGIAGRIVARSIETADDVAPGLDLVVRTRPANAAARRVAERAGFVDEGLEPGTTDMQLLRLRRRSGAGERIADPAAV